MSKQPIRWRIKQIFISLFLCAAVFFSGEMVYAMNLESVNGEVDVPVFMLLIEGEGAAYVTNAFYVQDTYGTGGTYLLTSMYAGMYADLGYHLYVVSGNCWEEVTEVKTDINSGVTYLKADNMEGVYPFPTEQDMEETKGILAVLEIVDDNTFHVDADEIDISGYQKSNGIYYTGQYVESLADLLVVGSPLLHGETIGMMGMFSMSTDSELIIYDLTNLDYPEEMAIVAGNAQPDSDREQESEQESEAESEQDKEGDLKSESEEKESGTKQDWNDYSWLIVVAVIAGVAFFVKSGNKKKPSEGQEDKMQSSYDVQPPYQEGTIILEGQEELQEQIERSLQQKETTLAKWQIRGISGVFEGQLFALQDRLHFGRNPQCEAAFPQGTKGVSGMHCEVFTENNRVMIQDMRSSYGTYVGHGIGLEAGVSYQLNEGDVFYLADPAQSFRLETVGQSRQELTPIVKAVTVPKAGEFYYADVNGRILFGKGERAQVMFGQSDTAISTNHCMLYKDNTGVYLMDMGSSNGTFLGEGQRLRPNTPYRVAKGISFFLVSPKYTFIITKD